MEEYNTLSNYNYAKLMLGDPYKYNYLELLHIYQYLILLKTNEEEMIKLDVLDMIRAQFNDSATSCILNTIVETIRDNKELAISMINKENLRLRKIINSYRKEANIERLSYEEMKDILLDYMSEEKAAERLNLLYDSDDKEKHM